VFLGYARVSTADQNPDHQVDALRRAGVAEKDIFVDHASGAKASRPRLDEVLRLLRDGDTLKITRLDRLGRSVLHLVTLGAELRDRGVGLHVIEQGIDTSTAEGRAMFGMLSVLAELQRELIIANTRDGLAAARLRGRKGGRRPRLNPEQAILAQQLYDAGERTVQQIADIFGVPRTTVYGHLNAATKGQRPVDQRTAVSR
jgi:DNA invertase Pin-like site-specific DNA recombinase